MLVAVAGLEQRPAVGGQGPVMAIFHPKVGGFQKVDRQRAVRALVIVAQIALLLVVLTRLVTASWALPIGILIVAILVAALVRYLWLYQANSSVVVTDSHILVTDWRGSTQAVPRPDVVNLVRMTVRPFEGPPKPVVIAVDAEGRSLFALGAAYDEVAIARSLSLPLSGSFSDVAALREIIRKYPGANRGPAFSSSRAFALAIAISLIVGAAAYIVWAVVR